MIFKKTAHRLCATLLAAVLLFSICPLQIAAENEKTWSVASETEIFLVKSEETEKKYKALSEQVKLFASELAEKVTGTALPISYGDKANAGTSDIVLVLGSGSGIEAQGYNVTVEGKQAIISASDAHGLFYGCRDLIKQLILSGSVVSVSDAPDVLERAVSLDNGRKYFSVEWIKEFIREMSWANMNTLVLHFSEEMGLGIESKLYPWLNGRDGTLCTQAEVATDNRYLTQDEVKEIAEYAKLYHIELVPSLDSPGHMNYIVKKFNEKCADAAFTFEYDGKEYTAEKGSKIGNYFSYNGITTAVVPGSRNAAYSRGIDISNEVAVAFTKSLIEEYATLFNRHGSTKIDIGGDELLGWGNAAVSTSTASRWQQLDHWKKYAQDKTGNSNAVAYDAFLLYMNDLNVLVRKLGYKSVRMWNDDALRSSDTGWTGVVQLDTNIDIWFWTTGTNTVWTYANEGYQVYNILSDYCYYAMTSDYFSKDRGSFTQAYADQIYNEWTPFTFDPTSTELGAGKNTAIGNSNVLGGAFGVWCDNPNLREQEADVMTDLLPLIRANAAKSWDVKANDVEAGGVDYDTYCKNWVAYGNAPAGTTAAGEIFVVADLTALQAAVTAYDTVDKTLYTTDSYEAYKVAVEAGMALLSADKPTQKDVDAAVLAITNAKDALELKPITDTAALKGLIDECLGSIIPEHYTQNGSVTIEYSDYQRALSAAMELLNFKDAEQSTIESAMTSLKAAVEKLEKKNAVTCDWYDRGAFKTSRVYVGKVATLSVSTVKNCGIEELLVYNELGQLRATLVSSDFVRCNINTRNADRDIWTMIFNVTEDERKDNHVYRVYAQFTDGSVSESCHSFEITVK